MSKNRTALKEEKAKELLKLIIQSGRNRTDLNQAYDFKRSGNKFEDMGLLDKAIEEYKKAIQLVPVLIDPHIDIAIVYGKKGMYEEAKKAYEEVINIIPDWPDLYYNMSILYRSMNLFEDAICALIKEREICGNELKINTALGFNYLDKAKIELENAKKNGFENKRVLFDLIVPLLEQSLNEYKEALVLDPENGEIKSNFNKACQLLDTIIPGRYQELGIKICLGRTARLSFNTNLKEKPEKLPTFIEFSISKIVKSIVVLSCYTDSFGIQWTIADLFDDANLNLNDYENLKIIGHLILKSNNEFSILEYDQLGKTILNSDEYTTDHLSNISEIYCNERSYRRLAAKILKIVIEDAETLEKRINACHKLGNLYLYGKTNVSHVKELLKELSPMEFDNTETEVLREAKYYFRKVIDESMNIPSSEFAGKETMLLDSKRSATFIDQLLVLRGVKDR